jgi:hypothetical protein
MVVDAGRRHESQVANVGYQYHERKRIRVNKESAHRDQIINEKGELDFNS